MTDKTPAYVAVCRECGAWRGISVIDPEMPETMKHCVRDRKAWEKDGYLVIVRGVDEWNDQPVDKRKHSATCSRRAEAKSARTEQETATTTVSFAQKA